MFKRFKYYHPHPFEDLHKFICEAMGLILDSTSRGSFEQDVLAKVDLDFRSLVEKEAKNQTDYLCQPLEELYLLIRQEPDAQKALLRTALEGNNEIEKICCSTQLPLVTYDNFDNKILSDKLRIFLNNLYTKYLNRASFVEYAAKRAQALGLKDPPPIDFVQHFRGLIKKSAMDICPFCGMHPLLNEYNSGRNAYDHFLPKGVIPFVSINFRNLTPMCDECNSKHKMAKVPVLFVDGDENVRVKAFYPYAKEDPDIRIGFKLKNTEKTWDQLLPEDIELIVTTEQKEEAKTWIYIFDIDGRYKAMTLGFVKKWLASLFTAYENHKVLGPTNWEDFMSWTLKTYNANLLMDQNFLKYALLKCLMDDADLIKYLNAFR